MSHKIDNETVQLCFSADSLLSETIEARRGDVPKSAFIRKTLHVALGIDKKGVVLSS